MDQAQRAAAGRRTAAALNRSARLTAAQVAERVNSFLLANGAAVRVNDAGREHGQIRAFSFSGYDSSKTVPTVVLRNEDYGRITRLVASGTPVTLEFTIVNRDYPAGRTSYNAIAEIAGTDKAGEVIMLGGHLDSWHAATGATDNAVGCAVMMEAARILSAIAVKPRRTIRVALWGGEEQGLIGSKAYVEQHFGTAENPKPAFASFGGYLNLDAGTGRVRGATVFGPATAAALLAQYFKPFEDLGVMGATATNSRASGSSDHTSFSAAGLPGITLGQDGIEYNSHTWHSNLDTVERIVDDDVKRSAVVVASTVYHLAMRDEPLPRFPVETMPSAPGAGRSSGAGGAAGDRWRRWGRWNRTLRRISHCAVGGIGNRSADAGLAWSRSNSAFAATIASTSDRAALEMLAFSFGRRPARSPSGVLAVTDVSLLGTCASARPHGDLMATRSVRAQPLLTRRGRLQPALGHLEHGSA